MPKFLSLILMFALHGCSLNVSRPVPVGEHDVETAELPPIPATQGFTVEALEVPDTFEIVDSTDISYDGMTILGADQPHRVTAGKLRFTANKRTVVERVQYVVRTGDSLALIEGHNDSSDANWLAFPGYEVRSMTENVSAWIPYSWSCVGSCSDAFVNEHCLDSGEGCDTETTIGHVEYQDCSSSNGGCHSTLYVPSGLIDETDREDYGLLTFDLRIAHVACDDTFEVIVYAIQTSEGVVRTNIDFTHTRRC